MGKIGNTAALNTTIVKRNTIRYEKEGPILNNITKSRAQNTRKKEKSDYKEINKLVSGKISSGDIRGAVRILSSESSVMPFDNTTFTKLKEKHPDQPIDLDLPTPPTEIEEQLCVSVSREEIRKCIMRFNPGSGAGHDSIFPQHLKDLSMESLGAASNDLLDSLCHLFNEIIFQGKIPNEICSSFYGAKLFALSKDDGGVRPIAVGITLRRWLLSCA